uniref:Sugar transporter family protein, putative, expressed n=2 Tax=Oryza TaxID=4527 RepID=Q10BC6_ORYSJ|nr:sugar transporter family protein, putative, expressed [Oryza sativa Japonica Group]
MAAKVGLFPSSSLTTSPHAIAAAPTNAPRPRGARGLASPGRSAAAMDAFHVSSQAAEPLLRTTGAAAAAAAAATATSNPRLRVRNPDPNPPRPNYSRRRFFYPGARCGHMRRAARRPPAVAPEMARPGRSSRGRPSSFRKIAPLSISLSAELSGTTWFSLSSIQLGLVASGSLYGALGGSLLAYRVADFLGRRIELVTAAALYISGALVTGFAPDFVLLIIGRLLYGIGIGLTGYLVGSLEIDVVGGWRYMFGFGAPLAVIMAIGMWNLPPSPRWLLLRAVQGKASVEDNKKKAIQALRSLRGRFRSDRVLADEIDDTLLSIKAAYAEQESEGNIWKMFEGASLKALIIGGGLVLFQQITGQPSVLYYATSILQTAGFAAASDAAKVSILIGLFKLLMTGVAVFKVDDLGRRPLLIGGIGGIAVSLFLLAAYYKILNSFPFVAVGALLLYVGSYQVSFGPISWLMVSEIFPLRTRGRGISLAVLTNFGSNALVTFAFSPLQEFLGPANIFLLFGAISLLSLVFVILKVPETKGLTLEEIESKLLK